jgi:putative ribosome biogenesis GTPase RsgA
VQPRRRRWARGERGERHLVLAAVERIERVELGLAPEQDAAGRVELGGLDVLPPRRRQKDARDGLEETKLDPFNLLFGASGVGKTKILAALRR